MENRHDFLKKAFWTLVSKLSSVSEAILDDTDNFMNGYLLVMAQVWDSRMKNDW